MRPAIFIVFILSLLVLGCAQEIDTKKGADGQYADISEIEPYIENQRDENGCLTPAGYEWCEPTQKCQRLWEEPCPTKNLEEAPTDEEMVKQVAYEVISRQNKFLDYDGYDINITSVEFKGCEGCFDINAVYNIVDYYEDGNNNTVLFSASLKNWQMEDIEETIE